jgi:hypothetical protein
MESRDPPQPHRLLDDYDTQFKNHSSKAKPFLMRLFATSRKAYNKWDVTDNSNPLRGIAPKVVSKDHADETTIVELLEKLPGEVAFDAYVKALMSTPEVAERVTELENCLQRLANAVWASGMIEKDSELRAATEAAAIALKNRLEVSNVGSRIRKRVSVKLKPFQDDLRLLDPSRTKPPDSKG